MQGQILSFQRESNTGLISGHDGVRYSFTRLDWAAPGEPIVGRTVDFEVSEKTAKHILYLTTTTTGGGPKTRVAAILLAFFLGGFGVHKFYLGQIGWGVLYLLFFWTFIPAIIAFVEFIILLCMSDQEFDRRFNQVR